MPRFSVIAPAYRVKAHLHECLASALRRIARACCRRRRTPGHPVPARTRLRHTLVHLGLHRTFRALQWSSTAHRRGVKATVRLLKALPTTALRLHYRVQSRQRTDRAACVDFLTVQAGAVVQRTLDPVGFAQPPRWPEYAWAARHIGSGEVVIADGYHAVHAIAGYGPNLAAPAWPDPALDERERLRRLTDVRAYLAPTSTRAERTAVVRRYHVRWLLLTRWHPMPEEAVVVAWSARTGEVPARVGRGLPGITR
ncbi:hypothetical protein M2271_007061 [Streptomyces sp. LBL]|nr:hypothetical protein [Streptomyces sp. LBL]